MLTKENSCMSSSKRFGPNGDYSPKSKIKRTYKNRCGSLRIFNFQGEFDFDESQHRDELEQDLQAMFDFQIDEDDLI